MRLTRAEILLMLEELSYVVVAEPTDKFPYRIASREAGYRLGKRGQLQAKLSIMLEALGALGGDNGSCVDCAFPNLMNRRLITEDDRCVTCDICEQCRNNPFFQCTEGTGYCGSRWTKRSARPSP